MRKTTFLLKEADVVQESSTLHFTEGFWPPWPMSEAKSGDICESYCKNGALDGLPNFFVVVLLLFVCFWMLVLMMCWFFPIKTLDFFKNCQQKKHRILFSYINYYLSDGLFCSMKRWYFSWISLSLWHMEILHLSWLEFGFSNACAVLRRHPLFEICKESQQTSRTWKRSFYQKNPEKDTKNLHVQTKVLREKKLFISLMMKKHPPNSSDAKTRPLANHWGNTKIILFMLQKWPTSW